MIELLKRVFQSGIGSAWMNKERLEEWARKVAEEGKFAKEEGKKFIDDVLQQAEETRKNIENQIKERVKNTVEKFGIPLKSELEGLKRRVDELEKKIRKKED